MSITASMSKGDRSRERIVAAAFERASRLGLEGVTIGELAEDLGVSKSGLYAHFRSKEALQIAALEAAVGRFVDAVVRPAIALPRGEPRVQAIFERHLDWIRGTRRSGGCFFMSATHEYDDRPGRVRDALVASQRQWLGAVERAARLAVEVGHFRADLDLEQFAYEFVGLGMAFHQAKRLFRDRGAEARAARAFEALLERSRRTSAGRIRHPAPAASRGSRAARAAAPARAR